MKFLDRFSLKLYAIIIGILSIMVALIVTNTISIDYLTKPLDFLTENVTRIKGTLIVCGVLLLLVLKSICFSSKPDNDGKDGIVLENPTGKLVISKESLENLIASVSKEIPGTETTTSKTIVDKDKNLKVYVTTVVNKDVMIKDVSAELQNRVKDAMKNTADLEVKEVNIKIKNITSKKSKLQIAPPVQPVEKVEEPATNTEEKENKEENNETGEE